MALGPRLDLRQTQSLVMTPQLQQAIKLLALSNLEIESFVADQLEANPLLEAGEMRVEDREAPAPAEEASAQTSDEGALDIDPASLDRDRDTGDWSASTGGGAMAEDLPGIEDRAGDGPTLVEHLTGQVGPAAPDARIAFVARHLIGLLDEAGYLTAELRHVAFDLGTDLECVEASLRVVQSLDPTGVGARSLSECLALQAQEADRYDPCMAALIDHLDLIAKGDIAKLKRFCGVDDEDFADMLAELRSYDPKPGLAFGGSTAAAIAPDILLTRTEEQAWRIRLNRETLPRLVVNRDYYLDLKQGAQDKASRAWLGEKLADANWLIKALDQRQKTILKVSEEIVKQQDGFFRRGVAHLKPLTLREVAEAIDMHESTVSRVTSNKYLACPRGTFELKYFFSSGVASSDGEGASAEAIKARIRALTDGEDAKKVLSDQKLADMLNGEGFDLARRTVAKYREAIGIGSSAQRRREKKLRSL